MTSASAGKSLRVAVAHAEAAAGEKIVADQFAVLDDGDEAEVVRENIHVVQRRNGEGGLEFARQISFAVERVNEIFGGFILKIQLNAFDPDLMVGGGFGEQGVGNDAAHPPG